LNSITRPKKKLFVIVNPFSGRKKGGKIADKLSKILVEADVSYKLIKTTHGGHAEEIARTESFSGYDALVVVSGDGLVNEVINGLRQREKDDAPPVAPIPAGSGNGLVASLGKSIAFKATYFFLIKPVLKSQKSLESIQPSQKRFTRLSSLLNLTAAQLIS
jgi:diacylglycerol kinase family enzyme